MHKTCRRKLNNKFEALSLALNELIMRTFLLLIFPACLLLAHCTGPGASVRTGEGAVIRWADFSSRYVPARHIDIWLPPGYNSGAETRYPVLYMHDGQNLFDNAKAGYGVEWGVDEAMLRLMAAGEAPPAIVVGIWNTPRRFMEYAPNKPLTYTPDTFRVRRQEEFRLEQAYSDEYLRFIVQELKPAVDSAFRTRPDRSHTFVMGSSMGGLISLYALLEYPDVFGGAGCVSTHWPLSLRYNDQVFTTAMMRYMAERLPQRRRPRVYFDYGTATLDALYEPSQLRIDSLMRAAGYGEKHWTTRKFPGAEHNEKAWQQRVDIPLRFLLGK